MERCPNCSARIREATSCRRCGMDLGLLMDTERAAERALARGIAQLARGDRDGARRALRRALALRRTPLAEQLARLAAVAELRAEDSAETDHACQQDLREDPPIFDLVTPLTGAKREERLPPKFPWS